MLIPFTDAYKSRQGKKQFLIFICENKCKRNSQYEKMTRAQKLGFELNSYNFIALKIILLDA